MDGWQPGSQQCPSSAFDQASCFHLSGSPFSYLQNGHRSPSNTRRKHNGGWSKARQTDPSPLSTRQTKKVPGTETSLQQTETKTKTKHLTRDSRCKHII